MRKYLLLVVVAWLGSAIIRKLNNLGYRNLIYPNSFELDLKNSDLVFIGLKKMNLI